MIPFFLFLVLVVVTATYWVQINNGELQVAPILGFMFGLLYSKQYIEEENVNEHWIQVCILCISFTAIWETSNG